MGKKLDYEFWKKIVAELFGCFCLTFFGCGTAIGDGGEPAVTALVFGCVIISMAYTIGPISGCHINPAVSLGMLVVNRLGLFDFIAYVIAQFIGAIIAGCLLLAIVSLTKNGLHVEHFNLGETGIHFDPYEKSALGINVGGGILIEIIMTFVFITVIIVNTGRNSPTGDKAGIVIGVTLTICIATGINFTGTSVNPARSFGPALALCFNKHYHGIAQWWVFLVAPVIGSTLAALFCRFFLQTEEDKGKINSGLNDDREKEMENV